MLAFSLFLPSRAVPVVFSPEHLLPASFLISFILQSISEVKNDHELQIAGWEEKDRNMWEECNRRQERRQIATEQQVEIFRPKKTLLVFPG